MPDIDAVMAKPFDRDQSRHSKAARRFRTLAMFDIPKDNIPASSRSALNY